MWWLSRGERTRYGASIRLCSFIDKQGRSCGEARKTLRIRGSDKLIFVSTRTTSSDLELPAFFGPGDIPADGDGVPPPGSFPFTRGLYEDMYRKRLWTMRQYAGYASATESNRRYRYLLDQGTTGLSVAFDLPTQIRLRLGRRGRARGEVGRVGVAIDSIDDMRTLFDGIPLGQVTTSMTINSTAAILLSMYLAVAEEQGVPWSALGGTVQNDILKEYIARGTHIYPPSHSLRLVTDLIVFCSEHVPRWNPISISGYHIREAGSTAAQEIAFTLANALCYVDLVLARGLDIDSFAPRLSFFFNAHNNFLEEVAKFRAARQLWAELVRERYQPRNERSCWLRFHTQTGVSTLTAQQPRTTSPGSPSRRWQRSAEAPSRCIRTAPTKPSACPPKRRRASRCAASRSSPTRPGWPTSPTRWAVPGPSKR